MYYLTFECPLVYIIYKNIANTNIVKPYSSLNYTYYINSIFSTELLSLEYNFICGWFYYRVYMNSKAHKTTFEICMHTIKNKFFYTKLL